MKVKLILWLLCCCFIQACEIEKEIHFNQSAPKAVLNAILYPDSVIKANVMCTINGVKPDNWGTPDSLYAINDAFVELFINDQSKGYMEKGEGYGNYISPGNYPFPHDKIRMEVRTKEYETVWSEINIPSLTPILSVDTVFSIRQGYYETTDLTLYIRFKDNAAERNFYQLDIYDDVQVWRGDSVKQGYSYTSFDLRAESLIETYTSWIIGNGIFNDNLINGQEYTLKILARNVEMSYKTDSIKIAHKYIINLHSITASSYYHTKSLIKQVNQEDILGDTGLREPIPTFTNITNGYGLLSGRYAYRVAVDIPFDTIPPSWGIPSNY